MCVSCRINLVEVDEIIEFFHCGDFYVGSCILTNSEASTILWASLDTACCHMLLMILSLFKLHIFYSQVKSRM